MRRQEAGRGYHALKSWGCNNSFWLMAKTFESIENLTCGQRISQLLVAKAQNV